MLFCRNQNGFGVLDGEITVCDFGNPTFGYRLYQPIILERKV